MLFLVVLGGAAALEVHRALHSGNKDIREIQRREEQLKRQLTDLQRELQQTRSQRELTEREAAQLSELTARLQQDKAELERESSGLRSANEELAAAAEALRQRQAALEQSEESLRQENANLLVQFDRLKIKYEQESSSFHEQLAELKHQVSGALQRFAAGELSAEALLAFLSGMGVEVRCRPEEVAGLPEQLNSARSREERLQLLDKVELKVDDSWVHQLRLSTCPDRAARLLMASRDASGSSAAAGATAALTYPQQPKKLSTPPKGEPKVPLLKLAAALPAVAPVGEALAAAAPAPALPAAAPAAQVNQPRQAPQQQLLAAPAPEPAAAPEPLRPLQPENKSRSLRFLPKKASSAKQARATITTPRLEMDVSLGENAASPMRGAGAGGVTATLSSRPRLALGSFGRGGGQPGGDEEELLGGASRALLSR